MGHSLAPPLSEGKRPGGAMGRCADAGDGRAPRPGLLARPAGLRGPGLPRGSAVYGAAGIDGERPRRPDWAAQSTGPPRVPLQRLDRLADVHNELLLRVLLVVVEVQLVAHPVVGLVAGGRQPLAHQGVPGLAELFHGYLEMPHGKRAAGNLHQADVAAGLRTLGHGDAGAGAQLVGRRDVGVVVIGGQVQGPFPDQAARAGPAVQPPEGLAHFVVRPDVPGVGYRQFGQFPDFHCVIDLAHVVPPVQELDTGIVSRSCFGRISLVAFGLTCIAARRTVVAFAPAADHDGPGPVVGQRAELAGRDAEALPEGPGEDAGPREARGQRDGGDVGSGIGAQEGRGARQAQALYEAARSLAGHGQEQPVEVEAAEARGVGHFLKIELSPAIGIGEVHGPVDAGLVFLAQPG